jgi:hypothetical protein
MPKIREDSVYLTDNGAAYCGAHLGVTARMTGRDLSGRTIMRVTPRVREQALAEFGFAVKCDQCGREA